MKTHVMGTETYGIFDHWNKGSVWMLHFLWGKKDFRIYLEDPAAARAKGVEGPILRDKGHQVMVSRLQYLSNFEWYDYEGVDGHGRSREETLWRRGQEKRRVSLPVDFYDTAVLLACKEFGLQQDVAA